MSQLHEECGVFGIYASSATDVARTAYYALYALQHRGQESCGIVVNKNGVVNAHRDVGLVNEVFNKETLTSLGLGQIAVGHVRYGTTGNDARLNVQPLVINHMKGTMVLAHNGNLTNDAELRRELELQGSIFHTTSDSEVISYIITKERLTSPSIEAALEAAMHKLKGAYSIVLMSPTKLIAARDPLGFRPLCIGRLGDSYVFSSETCALNAIGAEFVRDILPGEIVIVDKTGMRSIMTHCGKCKPAHCVFELIYFARSDSVIDGSSVHIARQRAGAFLALEQPAQADVVVGVPDSGLDAAIGYAHQSGIPYGMGFVKNKYIGRTFIQPEQSNREEQVRIKLSVIESIVKGKRVVLIDDSIVRGTTSACIVKLLRNAGATEVHFRSSAPKFLYPCYFGTDIDSQENLIAWKHTDEEMCKIIGVDSIGFLSTENVVKLSENSKCRDFCTACFTGQYPVEPPAIRGKSKYLMEISEETK